MSPVTATFYRAVYALPILAIIYLRSAKASRHGRSVTSSDERPTRERWLAFASGLILAVDLDLWHESIALVGAGLGTVIANVQVVFVATAAWLFYRERLAAGRLLVIAAVLRRRPQLGPWPPRRVRIAAGRRCDHRRPRRAVIRGLPARLPRRESHRGTAVRPAAGFDDRHDDRRPRLRALFDPHFTLTPPLQAHIWLLLLAVGSQVIGWLLIRTALPQLPAIETSVLLLGQPVFAVIWGVLIFSERLSPLQWIGSAIVLGGVALLSITRSNGPAKAGPYAPPEPA